jgi:outer membrane receptor protein involved in Fe transport
MADSCSVGGHLVPADHGRTGGQWTVRFLIPWLMLALTQAQPAGAESGAISGTVRDGWQNAPLPGVVVTVRGTTLAVLTDAQGRYTLTGVPPGEHSVVFARAGYARATVTEVRVGPSQTSTVDVPLRPEFYEMEEYEVTAEELGAQSQQILLERQHSGALIDAIGSEQFTRFGASDAADILVRVPAASIVEGKFAVIRGLSDRYTAATLNGAEIPSADPYRKSAQLDLFPAGLIDQIAVVKTFTPDQPGSFTGGSVNIVTESFPEKSFVRFSAGVTYNTQSSLDDQFLVAPGASADAFSLGRDIRSVPSELRGLDSLRIDGRPPRPNDPARRVLANASQAQRDAALRNAQTLEGFNRSLGTTGFAGVTDRSPLDHDYDLELGTTLTNVFQRRLGLFASMKYSRSFQTIEDGINNRYFADGRPRFLGQEDRGRMTTEIGGGANIAYELSPNHQLKFNLLVNQTIEDDARFVTGRAPEGDSQDPLVLYQLHYTERQVQAYQLAGSHDVPSLEDNHLDWLASYVHTTQNEPDYRFFHAFLNSSGVYGFGGNTLPQPNVPTRTFREIEENNLTLKLDDTQPFTWWRELEGQIKVGFYRSESWRDSYERSFSYVGDRGSDASAYRGSPNQFVRDDNLGYTLVPQPGGVQQYFFDRLLIDDFGNSQGGGTNTIYAGYAMLDAALLPRLRVVGGLRYETTLLDVSGRVGTNFIGNTLDEAHLLPAAGLVTELRTHMNLRLHFAQTIARPSFREITPTRNYDVTTDDLFIGNPFLEITEVNNYDLRWEWFRRPGEVLAASLFYKDLKKPIELEYTDQQANISTYRNRESATLYGIELEARTRLDLLWDPLADFSLGVNVAYIISKVPLTDVELATKRQLDPGIDSTRPLYDQSPYILNLDLGYDIPSTHTSITLAANLTGERLYIANPLGVDVYEHPPPSLDLIVNQRLSQHWKLRFTALNLLDPEYRRTYGSSPEGLVFSSYRRGMRFGLKLSAEF